MRYLFLAWAFSAAHGQDYPKWPHHIRFEGVVVNSTSGEPIPAVVVSATGCTQKTVTDAAGRFAVECPYIIDIVPVFEKAGYPFPGVHTQGVESRDAEGNPVFRQIVQRMGAPSKIRGKVIDAQGRPAPHVTVSAEPTDATMRGQSTTTDREGRFELQVSPASYRVCAISEFDSMRERETSPSQPRLISASACFPSARDRKHAVPVTAKLAENVGPFLIRLPAERTWRIAGRVVTRVPKTRDWTTQVWAIARPKEDEALPSLEFYRGRVDDETGRFVITGLRMGPYTLLVRAGPANQCYTCPMPPEYEVRLPIQVNRDSQRIVATIDPFSAVTGRVVVQLGSPPPQTERLIILDSGLPSRFSVAGRISAGVDATGDFRIERVPTGTYLVVQNERESQFLRTVRLDDQPVALGQIHVAPGSSPKLEIAFREAAATLAVRVEGDTGRWPEERLCVLAVPENGWKDPSSWAGPIQVSGDARAKLGVARPGVYLVFATRNLAAYPVHDWADALQRKEQQAIRVSLPGRAGEIVTLKPVILDFGKIASPRAK